MGRSMAGWFKCPADGWAAIAEVIAGPWPDEAVEADLVYWADRVSLGGKRPSRRQLQARWSRSEWDTRKLLSQSPPRILPESSQNHPKPKRAKANNSRKSSQNPPNSLPLSSQLPPHARLDQTQTQTTDTDIQAVNTKAAQLLADWTTAAEYWRDVVNPALGRQKRIPTAKSTVGRRLRSEIRANGLEAVLDSFRWLAHGQKWHARQQRANETTTLVTPLRHVEEWAEHWQRNGSAEDGPSAGRAPTKSLFDRMFNPEEPRMK